MERTAIAILPAPYRDPRKRVAEQDTSVIPQPDGILENDCATESPRRSFVERAKTEEDDKVRETTHANARKENQKGDSQ